MPVLGFGCSDEERGSACEIAEMYTALRIFRSRSRPGILETGPRPRIFLVAISVFVVAVVAVANCLISEGTIAGFDRGVAGDFACFVLSPALVFVTFVALRYSMDNLLAVVSCSTTTRGREDVAPCEGSSMAIRVSRGD